MKKKQAKKLTPEEYKALRDARHAKELTRTCADPSDTPLCYVCGRDTDDDAYRLVTPRGLPRVHGKGAGYPPLEKRLGVHVDGLRACPKCARPFLRCAHLLVSPIYHVEDLARLTAS
jgi:hypothetical protein